jgi:RimJ/RimL family protein N-acetyltransferase
MQSRLPLGEEVPWRPARTPTGVPLQGSHVLLRPIAPDADAQPLFAASHPPLADSAIWTYLPYGPFESAEDLHGMLVSAATSADPLYFALLAMPGAAPKGIASYLRITPQFGVIEVGHIWFGAGLARTTAATEAIYLLARRAFDELGYRRLEWKCDALNAASRNAAERFGFTFEGIFRKHLIVKGRNRDTAWFAITDEQWPALRHGYEAWLAPANFDTDGKQRRSLGESLHEARQRA